MLLSWCYPPGTRNFKPLVLRGFFLAASVVLMENASTALSETNAGQFAPVRSLDRIVSSRAAAGPFAARNSGDATGSLRSFLSM